MPRGLGWHLIGRAAGDPCRLLAQAPSWRGHPLPLKLLTHWSRPLTGVTDSAHPVDGRPVVDIDSVRTLFQADDYVARMHFTDRMLEREVSWDQVAEAIDTGRIVGERPKQAPYPEFLLVGQVEWTVPGTSISLPRPLFIHGALGDVLYLITCDWNMPREWGQRLRWRR